MQKSKLQLKIKKLFILFLLVISYQLSAVSPVFAAKDISPGTLGTIEGIGGFLPKNLSGSEVGAVLEKFISNTLGFFTLLGGVAFIIFFVIGALSWLTAGGKAEQLKKAQEQMTNAIIGLIIIVAAYSIIFIINQVLGLNILNPATELNKLNPKNP